MAKALTVNLTTKSIGIQVYYFQVLPLLFLFFLIVCLFVFVVGLCFGSKKKYNCLKRYFQRNGTISLLEAKALLLGGCVTQLI